MTQAALPVNADDRELLPLHARGDPHAFAELMRRTRSSIYGYIVRCGVHGAAADDVFQDVYFKVHRAAARYRPEQPLRPWLFTIVANEVRTYYRKRGVLARVFSPVEVHEPPSDHVTVQASAEGVELAAFLERGITKLPLKQREVLLLSCVEGMSLEEIAAALAMPVETVKTNLKRGRAALAKHLERRELTLAREGRR